MNPFFGIGAEKSATSWIFACLYEHPEVCIPVKEFNFFIKPELINKGKNFLLKHYDQRCTKEKVFGEYSTSYISDPRTARLIHEYFSDCKIVVSLRNPIDRAYSNYLNDIMAGEIDPNLPFEEAIKVREKYIDNGKYKTLLKSYYEVFDKKQIHIILYDDIRQDSMKVIRKLYIFLQVKEDYIPPSIKKKYNVSQVPRKVLVNKVSNKLAEVLQHNRWTNKIWWAIKKSGLPEQIRQANNSKMQKKISPSTYNQLISIFNEDIDYVQELTNRVLNWGDEREN